MSSFVILNLFQDLNECQTRKKVQDDWFFKYR